MKTTMTLATNLHISPFEIFAQDVDDVILMINFYLRLGKESNNKMNAPKRAKMPNKEERIRVNDKTATGGWY